MKLQHYPAAVAAVLLMAAGTPAHATLLDFEFSYTGNYAAGTVTGVIEGLTDNATSSASAVIIDSATISFPSPYTLPLNTVGDATVNTFTVTNGQITDADYHASAGNSYPGPSYLFELNYDDIGPGFLDDNLYDTFPTTPFPTAYAVSNNQGLAAITFTPFTPSIPEPRSIALLGIALAGLFLLRAQANRRELRRELALQS